MFVILFVAKQHVLHARPVLNNKNAKHDKDKIKKLEHTKMICKNSCV